MGRKLTVSLAGAVLGASLGYAAQAGAAGFAIIEHSAQGMGNAFAGGGAAAEDASSLWFNPASMAVLDSQVQAAGHIISPTFEFNGEGSVQTLTPFQGGGTTALLPGAARVKDGGTTAFVPNFYYVQHLNPRATFGLAVNVPFGLATEYDRSWVGRYQAVDSEIVTINVNPALSYRVSEHLSVGAGVSAQYIDATLSQALDFTQICAGAVATSATIAAFGPAAQTAATAACAGTPGAGAADGFSEVEADDISFGWNAGMLFSLSENTRVSLAYRSEIHHKLKGKARFEVPATALNTSPLFGAAVDAQLRAAFADGGIRVGTTLPDSLSLSAYHRFHPKFALMGDATWTDWGDVPELLIVFDNPATTGDGTSLEPLGWTDVWRLSAGLAYYHDERLTLRTGVAFDESPAKQAVLRTARLPDNSRVWVSVGASYRYSDRLSLDAGYTHLFIDDTPISRTGDTGNVLIGTYQSDADLFSLQARWVFD